MKKPVILLFLLISVSTVHAQTVEKQVRDRYLKQAQLTIDGKFEEALSYTNPNLFEIVPKEEMLKLVAGLFKS
ncbi:MAG: hypothetical protein EOP48_21255, partial [Sphingobacteriales bacterium]